MAERVDNPIESQFPERVISPVEGKMGSRAIQIVTGAAKTPISMTVGPIKLIISGGVLAVAGTAQAGQKVRVYKKKHSAKIAPAEIEAPVQEDWSEALLIRAKKGVAMSCLQMVPVIGSQLAAKYSETGNIKDFIDSPAFGSMLADIGISVPRVVYGFRDQPSIDPKREISDAEKTYFSKKNVSMEESVAQVQKAFHSAEKACTVRIPVKTRSEKVRYHDGTLLTKFYNSKERTIIMYHGNAQHRDDLRDDAKIYLNKGYNVLLMSYAGDHVIQGKGRGFVDASTNCSELAMREDARADVAFFKELGVQNVAVHGYSLGGAQAMNFSQALLESDLEMDYLVLDRTFTSVPEVVQNVVMTKVPNATLGRFAAQYARSNVLREVPQSWKYGCDALDSESKLTQIAQSEKFRNTKFVFLGAENDELMSRKSPTGERVRNFTYDLARALPGTVLNSGRLLIDIDETAGHCSEIDRTALEYFLFTIPGASA